MSFDKLVINVGKYKGKTFDYIYEHDASYCDWVVDTGEFDNDSLDAFYHYILLRSYYEDSGYRKIPRYDSQRGLNDETNDETTQSSHDEKANDETTQSTQSTQSTNDESTQSIDDSEHSHHSHHSEEEDSDEPDPEKFKEIRIDDYHSMYFIGSHKLSWKNWTRYYYWFWYEAHGKYYCSPSPYYDEWVVFDKMPEFIGGCIVYYDETKKKTFMALECCDMNCEECWMNGKIEIVGEFCYYKDNDDHKIYFAYSHYLGDFCLCRDEDGNYIENIISFEYHKKNYTDYFVIKTESGDYYSADETSSRFVKLYDYPNDIGED